MATVKFFTLPSGQRLSSGRFELDGISYPANWLELASDEDLSALGVTVELIDTSPQTRPPTADDVRLEAERRMMVLFGARNAQHFAVIISNAQNESIQLQSIRMGIPGVLAAREWTSAEAARAAQLWAGIQAINAIRAASNEMEPDPPSDYMDDSHWPM